MASLEYVKLIPDQRTCLSATSSTLQHWAAAVQARRSECVNVCAPAFIYSIFLFASEYPRLYQPSNNFAEVDRITWTPAQFNMQLKFKTLVCSDWGRAGCHLWACGVFIIYNMTSAKACLSLSFVCQWITEKTRRVHKHRGRETKEEVTPVFLFWEFSDPLWLLCDLSPTFTPNI